jgi:uncharacterized protein YcfJ
MNKSLMSLALVGTLTAAGVAAPAMAQYQQPTYQQPSGGYQQPTYQQPSGGYQQPTYQQPSGGYQQPTYQQPSGYQQPTYQQYPQTTPTQYSQPRQFNVGIAKLSAGTTISVGPNPQQGALYLNTDRTYPYSLLVAEDVLDNNGNVAIPANSEIRGTFRPARGGLVYVADSISINGRIYTVNATSKLLRDVKDPRYQDGGKIAGDAAIGAAGGAVIGLLTGGVSLGTILGGAATGAVVGNVTAPQVVVVDPNNPVDIRLKAPLSLRY